MLSGICYIRRQNGEEARWKSCSAHISSFPDCNALLKKQYLCIKSDKNSSTDNHLALRQHRSSRIIMANAYRTSLVKQISRLIKSIGVDFNGCRLVAVHTFRNFLDSDFNGNLIVQRTKRGLLIITSLNERRGHRNHRIHTMRTRDLVHLRNALVRKAAVRAFAMGLATFIVLQELD